MAKDPFSNIPEIHHDPSEHDLEAQSDSVDDGKDISKGAAPKKVLDGISKIGVPLMFLGVVVWLLLPQEHQQRKIEAPAAVVDRAVQVSNTSALLDSLKEEASKAPAPQSPMSAKAVAAAPGAAMTPSAAGGVGAPANNSYSPAHAPDGGVALAPRMAGAQTEADNAMAAYQARVKREEEIRASPLEASGGSVKLLADSSGTGQAQKSRATQLEDEMAATTAKANAIQLSMSDATVRAAAGLGQAATTKSKNPNDEFLSAQGNAGAGTKVLQQQPPSALYLLQQGTVVRTVLLTSILSDLPGQVSARVTSDVYDSIRQRDVLIPKGSMLTGVYNNEVAVGQERLLIAMTRLILPNGTWVALGGAPATNSIGQSGLVADVNNHFFKMFSTSFILGASSFFLSDKKSSVSTSATGAGNVTTGSVAGLALNDALNTLMQRNKNIAPTLSTGHGTEFMFIVSQDMSMVPYR